MPFATLPFADDPTMEFVLILRWCGSDGDELPPPAPP